MSMLRTAADEGYGVDRRELIERGDANLVAYLRHVARTATGGSVAEPPGLLLFAGGHNHPGAYINGVIRDGVPAPAAAEVLSSARDFFGPRGRGFAVWVREHADADLDKAARAAGLWRRPPAAGNPGVATDRPLPAEHPPAGVEIRRAEDPAARRDYLRVVASAYGVADVGIPMAEAILFSLASLDAPEVAVFVAYRDGRPVSGAMTYVAAGAAGLYWLATVPSARGGRLGHSTLAAACGAGFAMGARCASAQSSAVGTPILTGMGFDVVTHYRRYLAPPPGR